MERMIWNHWLKFRKLPRQTCLNTCSRKGLFATCIGGVKYHLTTSTNKKKIRNCNLREGTLCRKVSPRLDTLLVSTYRVGGVLHASKWCNNSCLNP